MISPVLSVIIPVYNSEKYIRQCLESVIRNDLCSMEIILIDDGSTDNSAKICDEIAHKYENIRVIHTENGGVSKARNIGIENSNGEYLMFVDSDDYIDAEFMGALLCENDEDFSITGYCIFDDKTQRVENKFECFESLGHVYEIADNIEKYLYPPYLLSPWGKLFKKSVIDKYSIRFPEEISYCEDAVFVFEYLIHSRTYVSKISSVYYYRKHGEDSLSTRFAKNLFECEILLNNQIKKFLTVHKIDSSDNILRERLFYAFIFNTRKLVNSDLNISEKNRLFAELVSKFDLIDYFKNVNSDTIESRILKRSVYKKKLSVLLFLLSVYRKIKSLIYSN